MKVIYKKRGAGKTTELIKKSAETGTYILVANAHRQRALADIAHRMGFHIPFPVTVQDYYGSRFRESFIRNILIDDADAVLQHIFSTVQIDAITLTAESDEQER